MLIGLLCVLALFLLIYLLLIKRGASVTRWAEPAERYTSEGHFCGNIFEFIRAPRRFSALRVADAFDCDRAVLWDTQIPALEVIGSAGASGLPIEELWPFYVQSAATYPELYEGSNFEGWVQFLEDSELVERIGSTLVITVIGSEFLKCRVTVVIPMRD